MAKSKILSVKDLTKIFYQNNPLFPFIRKKNSEVLAVNNISFDLHAGEILGLLGPNGAGKTTTIQMLLGTLLPTEGSIHCFGQELQSNRPEILRKVSHVSAYTKLPGSLTVYENLDIYGRLYGVSDQERPKRIEHLLEAFGILSLRNRFANSLSAGQTTRVMLVKAFLSDPKVVLLDEPTASLDPDIATETRRFILQQQQEFGVAMILTSHNMQEVAAICNRVLVLQQGSIIEEDSPRQLANKVAPTEIELSIHEGTEAALKYVQQQGYAYSLKEPILLIKIDESLIASLLNAFAKLDVHYQHIEIRKPNLEDYFLSLTHKGK